MSWRACLTRIHVFFVSTQRARLCRCVSSAGQTPSYSGRQSTSAPFGVGRAHQRGGLVFGMTIRVVIPISCTSYDTTMTTTTIMMMMMLMMLIKQPCRYIQMIRRTYNKSPTIKTRCDNPFRAHHIYRDDDGDGDVDADGDAKDTLE